MKNEMFGFTKVQINDHEFAKYLRDLDPKWRWKPINLEWTNFVANKKIVAIARYTNDPPVRETWMPTDMIPKGTERV